MKYRRKMVTPSLARALLGILLIGCDKNGQKAAARLPDLPQDRIEKLKPIPRSHLLATSQLQRVKGPPPESVPPAPPCTKDAEEEDFTAPVKFPITVCQPIAIDPADTSGVFLARRGPTHKIENAKLPPDLQAAGINPSAAASQASNFFWTCRTEEGPWQGFLTSERQCIFSCAPLNTLELDNAPNFVVWQWYGRIEDHPSDFEFDGKPVSLGSKPLGACH